MWFHSIFALDAGKNPMIDVLSAIYTNIYTHLFVICGYIAYVLLHEVRIARFIKGHGASLSYWDRLMSFRNPFWTPRAQLTENQQIGVKKMAWQFLTITLLAVLFFLVGYLVFRMHANSLYY